METDLERCRSTTEYAQKLEFSKKKITVFDMPVGTNVAQCMLLQIKSRKISIVSENLERFLFS